MRAHVYKKCGRRDWRGSFLSSFTNNHPLCSRAPFAAVCVGHSLGAHGAKVMRLRMRSGKSRHLPQTKYPSSFTGSIAKRETCRRKVEMERSPGEGMRGRGRGTNPLHRCVRIYPPIPLPEPRETLTTYWHVSRRRGG